MQSKYALDTKTRRKTAKIARKIRRNTHNNGVQYLTSLTKQQSTKNVCELIENEKPVWLAQIAKTIDCVSNIARVRQNTCTAFSRSIWTSEHLKIDSQVLISCWKCLLNTLRNVATFSMVWDENCCSAVERILSTSR